MNNSILGKIKKTIFSFCAIVLIFGLVASTFTNTASAETNNYNEVQELEAMEKEYEEFILSLNQDLLKLEEQINDYLNKIPYTEEDLQALSNEEFNKIFDTYFNNEEFLKLEKEYMDTYEILESQQISIQPKIAPILVPIVASVGRVALQTVVKNGTRVASSYLKKHIKNIGKNYIVTWNVKNSKKEITTLLMIQHKSTKQPVFRLDNGSLHAHLTPGTSEWFWHFHIGATPTEMKQHYSLRSIIPSQYSPKSSLTLF